jgi:hypothetical protein
MKPCKVFTFSAEEVAEFYKTPGSEFLNLDVLYRNALRYNTSEDNKKVNVEFFKRLRTMTFTQNHIIEPNICNDSFNKQCMEVLTCCDVFIGRSEVIQVSITMHNKSILHNLQVNGHHIMYTANRNSDVATYRYSELNGLYCLGISCFSKSETYNFCLSNKGLWVLHDGILKHLTPPRNWVGI